MVETITDSQMGRDAEKRKIMEITISNQIFKQLQSTSSNHNIKSQCQTQNQTQSQPQLDMPPPTKTIADAINENPETFPPTLRPKQPPSFLGFFLFFLF